MVPSHIKYLYGLGDIALVVKGQMIGLFTLYLYTTVMGLPASWVGAVSAAGLLWDAAIDPYIGYLSDRTGSRLGRRHLFMLAGALTMGASFWLYFAPPQGLSASGLLAWFLAANLLLRTLTSLFGVPYYALGAELSQDYDERTSVTGVRSACALAGTLAASVLSFLVFFPNTSPDVDPKLDYGRYPSIGLWFGLTMTVVGLAATVGSFEARKPAGPASVSRNPGVSRSVSNFLASFTVSLKNPSFRVLFFSYSLFFLGIVANALLSNHYFTYYVQILDSKVISAFHLCFFVCALAGVPFWIRMAKAIEKKTLYVGSMLVMTSMLVLAWLFMGEGRMFGTGRVAPLLIGNSVAGFFAAVLWIIPPSMIADITDLDTIETGERREGSYFGLFFFGQQVATAIALLLVGFLVDHFAGLVPGQSVQSATTADRIGLLFGLLPAICLLTGTLFIALYDLDRKRLLALQKELGMAGNAGSPSDFPSGTIAAS